MLKGRSILTIVAALLLWSATSASAQWIPPIGIPRPSFGIEESVNDSTFTHWVDNSVACSDASNGTPANPRCTIPTTLAAGSIVQVRGGPYTIGTQTWTLNGTVSQPVFIRGPSTGPKPSLGSADIDAGGTYGIVENLTMQRWTFASGAGNHHLVLRHSTIADHPGTGGAVIPGTGTSDIVIYDNEIARNGVIPSSADHHGVNVLSLTNNIWIVDNHIHHNSGDAVQFCNNCVTAAGNTGPANVYIGRNELHDDEENAIDLKEFIGPVIVSQNKMYGYQVGTFSGNGDAIRVNDEGEQGEVWFLFNDIWDNVLAMNAGASLASAIYFIGNEVHDISGSAITTQAPAGGAAVLRVVNNTFINISNNAIGSGEAKGNIIRATTTAIAAGVVGCSHNHVQQGAVSASCTNGTTGDPLLIMSGVHVVGIQSSSPAVDTGFADHPAYATFQTQYDRNIKFDRNGVARPQGAGWDRGAYEFGGSPGGGGPPSAPTNLVIQ